MLVDGYEEREMRDVLTTEMYFFRRRRQKYRRLRLGEEPAPAP
jgi:hypothetical protein